MVELDGRRVVEDVCRSNSRFFNPIANWRIEHFTVVADRLQFPIASRCECNCLNRLGTMTRSAEHLLPREFQSDRARDDFRRHYGEDGVRPSRTFAAKG